MGRSQARDGKTAPNRRPVAVLLTPPSAALCGQKSADVAVTINARRNCQAATGSQRKAEALTY